jgi:hypothetical protein
MPTSWIYHHNGGIFIDRKSNFVTVKSNTMKKILTLFLILTSCSEPDEIIEKQAYTFFVYAADQKEFTALIQWGVNGLQDKERVTSWGFASSVELYPTDSLVLQVDMDLMVKVTENKDGTGTVYSLTAGQSQAINP